MEETPEPSLVVLGRRGRPPRSERRATNRIEFVVTDDEREQLRKVAAEAGRPLAAVIRDAVDEFVSDYQERRVFSRD